MKNTDQPIKAAPTARGGIHFDSRRNILEDALYEMGYDNMLVDPLIKRNVIDFSIVDYTSDIQYQLREHYVLTAEALEESDKVKLFEHFIDDLKKVI